MSRPCLRALLAAPFVLAEWEKATVNIDYHVEFDGAYYSVSYVLVRQEGELRITAVPSRSSPCASGWPAITAITAIGYYNTLPKHMPAAHRAHAEWPPGKFLTGDTLVRPATAELVQRILTEKKYPEQGCRTCLGLMRLTRNYGRTRMEAACARALSVGALRYRSVASIL